MSVEFISGSGDWSLVTFLMRVKMSWWISRRRWSWGGSPAQKTKKKPGSEKLVVSVSCEELSMKWKVSEHLYTNRMIDDRTWLEPIHWSMVISAKMKSARGSRVKHPSVIWSADVSIWLFTSSRTLHTPVNQPAAAINRSSIRQYITAGCLSSVPPYYCDVICVDVQERGVFYYYIILLLLFCYFWFFIVEVTELINDEMINRPR